MKLSFVIPAYNEEAYLGKCLASIFREIGSQETNIEVIVVNNASTDKTRTVAESFLSVIIVDEPEKGIVKARRAGFLASHGELIANVDADTMLTPGWIQTVLREFQRNPRLVALSGPFIYYDLSLLTRMFVYAYYLAAFPIYLLTRFVLRIGSMLQGGNFVVTRSALERIGGFNLSIDFYGEDTDLARRLHAVGPVKFTFRLPMYSSGRRLLKEGVLATGFRYVINYFWTMFLKKPYTKKSTVVRISNHK